MNRFLPLRHYSCAPTTQGHLLDSFRWVQGARGQAGNCGHQFWYLPLFVLTDRRRALPDDQVRPGGNRWHEQYSGASNAPVPFVPNEDSKVLEVARFPIAEVAFLNRHSCGNPPAKLSLIREPCFCGVSLFGLIVETTTYVMSILLGGSTAILAGHGFSRNSPNNIQGF